MPLPTFTTRQLLISITWFAFGFALIGFSLRPWKLTPYPADDLLAGLEMPICWTARIVGWTFICRGVIPMLTTRRAEGLLAKAFTLGMLGGIVSLFFLPVQMATRKSERPREVLIPWIAFAIVSGVYILAQGFTKNPETAPVKPRKGKTTDDDSVPECWERP